MNLGFSENILHNLIKIDSIKNVLICIKIKVYLGHLGNIQTLSWPSLVEFSTCRQWMYLRVQIENFLSPIDERKIRHYANAVSSKGRHYGIFFEWLWLTSGSDNDWEGFDLFPEKNAYRFPLRLVLYRIDSSQLAPKVQILQIYQKNMKKSIKKIMVF